MTIGIDLGRDHIADIARRMVRGGYDSRVRIIETIEDYLQDEQIEGLSASHLVDGEIRSLVEESESWPRVTDYDRLNDAFEHLEDMGIVMRQNFTCCGTCGAAEIGYEIGAYHERGRHVVGYGFFHQQSTESAVDGYGLGFSYGSVDQDATDPSHVAIGKQIADEMRRAGLEVDWSGELRMCVMVGLKWQRRWGTESRFTQEE